MTQAHLDWRAFARMVMPHVLAVTVLLALVARQSPEPYPTDQAMMERVGQGVIVPGCADLNCFRILVPAVVEAFPGPALPRWRAYAVAGTVAAAVAAAALALQVGLGHRVALTTLWLSALGAGSMAAIHHPFNADPLVWSMAPLITVLLLRNRINAAIAVTLVGLLAKEFAAAALFISAAASALQRRWRHAWRLGGAAVGVTAAWAALHVTLMQAFGYSYNDNPSSQPLAGGYLRLWLTHVTPVSGALAVFGTFGALYLVLPSAWSTAPAALRSLLLGSIPAVLAFVYVATPERVIWNFFFLVVPLAGIVMARLPLPWLTAFVALFALSNLRIGAQMSGVPASRYAVALTVVLAGAAIWLHRGKVAS